MANNVLTLGVELLHAENKGVQPLLDDAKQASTTAYVVNGQLVLAPLDDDCRDLIEDHVEEMGLDTLRIRLVYINPSDSNVIDGQGINEAFFNELNLDGSFTGDFPASDLPDLVDFVAGNPDLVDTEMLELTKQYYAASLLAGDGIKANHETESSGDAGDEGEAETHSEEVVHDNSSPKEETSTSLDEPKEPVGQDQDSDDLGLNDLFDDAPADPLLSEAAKRFELEVNTDLPEFDELTHQQLQDAIINANLFVADAKHQAEQVIYQRLVAAKQQALANVDKEVISGARERHEETLNVINQNAESDVKQAAQAQNEKYTADRDAYIQKMIPTLTEQYDAAHMKDHLAVVQTVETELWKGADDTKQQEQDKFDAYVQDVRNKGVEKGLNNVDISDVVSEFNATKNNEVQQLLEQAQQFQGSVSEREQDLQGSVNDLSVQLNEVTQQRNVLQQTMDSTVQAKEKIARAEIATQYEERIKNVNDRASNEVTAAKQSVKQAEDELNAEKAKAVSLAKRLEALDQRMAEQQAQLVQLGGMNPYQQAGTMPQLAPQPRKSNLWLTAVAAVAVVFGLLGSGYGIGSAFSHNNSGTEATASSVVTSTDETSSSATSSNSDSSSSDQTSSDNTKSMKEGDTFPYRTSDGKAVTVTVDSSHTGHYVTSDDKYHTVVF